MAKHLIIVGAQRSGTTYLYKILDEHPEIHMAKPIKPEPKYFMGFHAGEHCYEEYFNKYFSMAGDASWLGEKSTSYIESEDAAQQINRVIPDATILVMLRNPIERAISHYSFTKDNNLEPYDLERAIQEESARKDNWKTAGTSVTPYAYTERGKYIQHLERWERLFGKDRLIMLVAERFMGSQTAVSALYKRLGIDSKIAPTSLAERVNASFLGKEKQKLSNKLRAELDEMYRPWNRELETRYGLDLSCWENKA